MRDEHFLEQGFGEVTALLGVAALEEAGDDTAVEEDVPFYYYVLSFIGLGIVFIVISM